MGTTRIKINHFSISMISKKSGRSKWPPNRNMWKATKRDPKKRNMWKEESSPLLFNNKMQNMWDYLFGSTSKRVKFDRIPLHPNRDAISWVNSAALYFQFFLTKSEVNVVGRLKNYKKREKKCREIGVLNKFSTQDQIPNVILQIVCLFLTIEMVLAVWKKNNSIHKVFKCSRKRKGWFTYLKRAHKLTLHFSQFHVHLPYKQHKLFYFMIFITKFQLNIPLNVENRYIFN